ncbi:MAG: hypothetical protein LBO70_07735 [Clostridiales Family XIII bacterium]|jgi:hypothetical protein|nr:hypothetical protein [Clostridiales Family XIII bacterium]
MRTAIDEDYADGKLNPSVTYGGINYFSGGEINGSNKVFDTSKMSRAVWEDNPFIYGQRSAAFIGETFVNSSNAPGYWLFYIIAPDDPSYTILNAPSFIFRYYPDGQKKDNTFSAVFYGFDNIPSVIEKETDIDNALSQITCNPDAGYKVFTNLTRNR